MGIAVGLGAGIFEELGWTGFAIPRMKLRYGVLSTGLSWGCCGERGTLYKLLGKRRYLRRALPGPLAVHVALGHCCRAIASLQGAHGVGLRAY